jgi:hypothetical protein
MASFTGDSGARTPFGKNAYLRSTSDVKTESYTVSAAAFPANATVDGEAKKVLQPGTLMAKITSTAEAGKIGVYDSAALDGRQTQANIVGICDTFVPWQLNERDVDVAVVYEAAVVEAWCLSHVSDVQTSPIAAGAVTACKAQVPTILFK